MAIASGNGVALKVGDNMEPIGRFIESLLTQAGIPKGLVLHLEESGPEVSRAMFAAGVGKYFHRLCAVGKILMKQAADTLTPVVLELGGNDPMIVLQDADLERATNGALWAGTQNAGQTCAGIERIYCRRYLRSLCPDDEPKIKNLRHGPSHEPQATMGAMITRKQYETVKSHIEEAVSKGANITAQTHRRSKPLPLSSATLLTK